MYLATGSDLDTVALPLWQQLVSDRLVTIAAYPLRILQHPDPRVEFS